MQIQFQEVKKRCRCVKNSRELEDLRYIFKLTCGLRTWVLFGHHAAEFNIVGYIFENVTLNGLNDHWINGLKFWSTMNDKRTMIG